MIETLIIIILIPFAIGSVLFMGAILSGIVKHLRK